ncbi:MAG: hydantoinase B/oxoprolinase family protein, partial [Bradyrhizobium sp.]
PLETMRCADVFITNDPWKGTGHLNDFVVVTPCFKDDRPVGLFCCTSHVMDIGGLGFGPDGSDVFMEGLHIPMLKLFEQGKVNETLMAMIRGNTRQQVETEGDTYALAACNDVGVVRLLEMMEEFAIDDLEELSVHILTRSRDAMASEIRKLPKGTWKNAMTVDGYDTPIVLSAALTISDDGIHVDYAGSSPQSPRGINVAINYAAAYTMFGLACAIGGGIPNNSGSLSMFSIAAPNGSVLNALKPAPVSTRHVIGQMLPDVIFGCLRQIVPDRVPAEGASSVWLITMRGESEGTSSGRYGFTVGFTSNGGTGARSSKDGLSATAFPTSLSGTPVEIAETQTPLLFWRKELREGSGGAGKTRGGLGQVLEIESACHKPFQVLASFDRIAFAARGHEGGQDGSSGFIGLKSGRTLKGKGAQEIDAGERLVLLTPGGAGRGDPRNRAKDDVARDVRDGLISADVARSIYGMV